MRQKSTGSCPCLYHNSTIPPKCLQIPAPCVSALPGEQSCARRRHGRLASLSRDKFVSRSDSLQTCKRPECLLVCSTLQPSRLNADRARGFNEHTPAIAVSLYRLGLSAEQSGPQLAPRPHSAPRRIFHFAVYNNRRSLGAPACSQSRKERAVPQHPGRLRRIHSFRGQTSQPQSV